MCIYWAKTLQGSLKETNINGWSKRLDSAGTISYKPELMCCDRIKTSNGGIKCMCKTKHSLNGLNPFFLFLHRSRERGLPRWCLLNIQMRTRSQWVLEGKHISWISKDFSYYAKVDFKSLFMLNEIPLCLLSLKKEGKKEVTDVLQNWICCKKHHDSIEFTPMKAVTWAWGNTENAHYEKSLKKIPPCAGVLGWAELEWIKHGFWLQGTCSIIRIIHKSGRGWRFVVE